jgi:hypothetical protein
MTRFDMIGFDSIQNDKTVFDPMKQDMIFFNPLDTDFYYLIGLVPTRLGSM